MLNPRSQALALKIWARAEPLGWDISIPDLAADLGETPQRVGAICHQKGWMHRLRRVKVADYRPRSDAGSLDLFGGW